MGRLSREKGMLPEAIKLIGKVEVGSLEGRGSLVSLLGPKLEVGSGDRKWGNRLSLPKF